MVGLITLDCWDTVLENSEAWDAELVSGFHRVLSERRPEWTADRSLDVFHQESKIFSETLLRKCATPPAVERLKTLGQIAHLELSDIQIRDLCGFVEETIFHPIPKLLKGASELCHRAKDENLALGIISNTGWFSGRALRNVLGHYGLLSVLDVVAFSDEVGHAKPHKEIFDSAREALGVDARRCVHIGDNLMRDVEGALAAGYSGIHFHKNGNCSNPFYPCIESLEKAWDIVAARFGISAN